MVRASSSLVPGPSCVRGSVPGSVLRSGSQVPGRLILALVTAVVFTLSTAAQEIAGQQREERVHIEAGDAKLDAWLRLPEQPARPPIVVVASGGPEVDSYIGRQLQQAGIASLRLDAPGAAGAPDFARAIAYLRNRSDQFPTVTVFTPGRIDAIVAARVARADGLAHVSKLLSHRVDDAAPAYLPEDLAAIARIDEELKFVLAARKTIAGTDFSADMAEVIAFAKSVRAFGRRGGPAARAPQPRRSPRHVVLANVGGVRVGVEWGSPQKRGREIWGSLVKWDAVWMPGADEATTLTTNGPIVLSASGLASLKVPAGDHTLYTLPGGGRFELIVSKDVGQFHTVHAPELELGRLVMQRTDRAETMEGLTFAIEPRDTGAVLKIIWDNREYFVQVTPTQL